MSDPSIPSAAARLPAFEKTVDLLVFGAGIGGLAAALYGRINGLEVLLCEKTALIGGTTASSGGIIWAPRNPHARAAGAADSREEVLRYLQGETGAAYDAELAEAFVDSAPDAIATLEKNSAVRFGHLTWPDYHPDRPGAAQSGRTLESGRFDGRRLGAEFRRVRPPLPPLMLFGGMQVDKRKVDDFLNPFRSFSTFFRVIRTFARYGADRLRYPRGTELGAGNALVASLFFSLREKGADVWTDAPLLRLLRDDSGRVTGATLRKDGRDVAVRARRGVVLATGGFPHNMQMRQEFSSDFPHDHSFGYEANVGEGISAARGIGATMDTRLASPGYWQPSSSIRDADGIEHPVLYGYLDRGRPGVIAVNSAGKRFVNEANSYHDVGRALIDNGYGRGESFYFVCDREFVWTHGLGLIRPFQWSLQRHVRSGYITIADTIPELARKIGVDPEGLSRTVTRHNEFARTGIDADFGKGSTAYNRLFGHPRARPNGNLAPIRKAPFVALRLQPTTLGTAVGLSVDRDAQVLDQTGRPIGGLYACGNDMASVVRGCYPAGGITLGPALVFAYRAACHASVGSAQPQPHQTPQDSRKPAKQLPAATPIEGASA